MYLSVTVLFPNSVSDAMQMVQDKIEQQGSMGEEQENAIGAVINNLPAILTFGMLIWCTIFGLIVSAIIASSVKQLPIGGFNPNNFDANNFNPDSFNNNVASSESTNPEDITPDKTGDVKPGETAGKPSEPADKSAEPANKPTENKEDESRFIPGGDKPEDPNDKYMPK
jgi:hypothetical protein